MGSTYLFIAFTGPDRDGELRRQVSATEPQIKHREGRCAELL